MSTDRPSLWSSRSDKKATTPPSLEALSHEVATLRGELAELREYLSDQLPAEPLKGSPAARRQNEQANRERLASMHDLTQQTAAEQRARGERLRNPYGLLDREYDALPDALRLPLEAKRQRAEQGNPAEIQGWGWTVAAFPPPEVTDALIRARVWTEAARGR